MKRRRTRSAGFDDVEQMMMHSGREIKHSSFLSRLNRRKLSAGQISKNWPQIRIEKQISLRGPGGSDSKHHV